VIDAIVPGREPSEVSNYVDFRELGHSLQVVIAEIARINQHRFGLLRDIELWD